MFTKPPTYNLNFISKTIHFNSLLYQIFLSWLPKLNLATVFPAEVLQQKNKILNRQVTGKEIKTPARSSQ